MSHSLFEAISISSGKISESVPRFSGKMERKGLPLNGDSELLRVMDNRMMFMGHIALLQVMQPHTGAGVEQHSDVYDNTFSRLIGSIQMITASAFDAENGEKIAQFITAQHKSVNGVDHTGKRYSALNPESWSETFDTFFEAARQIFLRYDMRASDPVRRKEILEQMYLEYITWYQRFGITDKYIAPDYDSFCEKWQNMVENRLVMTEAARWGFGLLRENKFPFPTVVPELARRAMNIPLIPSTNLVGKIIMSGIPAEIRSNKKYKDIMPSYTAADAIMVRGFEESVKHIWPLLPPSVRYPAGDLESLQKLGKYNDILGKTAVVAWKTTKTMVETQSSTARSIRSTIDTVLRLPKTATQSLLQN